VDGDRPDGRGSAEGSGGVVSGGGSSAEVGGGGIISKFAKILRSEVTARWARGKRLGLRYEMVHLSVRPVCSSVNR
jgi:hypothetical protein